jgi:hypothetical protein
MRWLQLHLKSSHFHKISILMSASKLDHHSCWHDGFVSITGFWEPLTFIFQLLAVVSYEPSDPNLTHVLMRRIRQSLLRPFTGYKTTGMIYTSHSLNLSVCSRTTFLSINLTHVIPRRLLLFHLGVSFSHPVTLDSSACEKRNICPHISPALFLAHVRLSGFHGRLYWRIACPRFDGVRLHLWRPVLHPSAPQLQRCVRDWILCHISITSVHPSPKLALSPPLNFWISFYPGA